jgi:hypothetical protein
MSYLDLLRAQFNDRVAFREKRPGVHQLIAPLYHEDGDMLDIILEQPPGGNGLIRVCDHAMTLMRLSYSFELDTPKKEQIFKRILDENGIQETNGNLFIDARPESLYPAVLQFAQVVSKVSSMRLFRREIIHSLFLEMLDEIIEARRARFPFQKPYYPLPDQEEYEVDYCFNGRPKPVFLFGVNTVSKARLVTISCQQFQIKRISFRSAVVLESLDLLGRKDQARLMSAADKEFPSLDDFQANGERFLERDLA